MKSSIIFSLQFFLSFGSGACGLFPAMGREGGLIVWFSVHVVLFL